MGALPSFARRGASAAASTAGARRALSSRSVRAPSAVLAEPSPIRGLAGHGHEHVLRLERFGGHVELRVQPAAGQHAEANRRMQRAAGLLAEFDARLSRFDAASELCSLNGDPRDRVPASPMMLRFVEAVGWAGRHSGGLVDATVLPAVERAGYTEHLPQISLGNTSNMAISTTRPQSLPERTTVGHWRDVRAGIDAVARPAGVRLDSGGIGKGLAADLAGDLLRGAPSWVVDCGGDLRIGGTSGIPRPVDVFDPVDGARVLHRLYVSHGGVATSGITRRAWTKAGERSHHLIDPRTGRPAATGVLQVTALAPTALEAEVLAKTALLSGRHDAADRLEHGGVIVCADATVMIVPPPAVRRRPRARRRQVTFHVPGHAAAERAVEVA